MRDHPVRRARRIAEVLLLCLVVDLLGCALVLGAFVVVAAVFGVSPSELVYGPEIL